MIAYRAFGCASSEQSIFAHCDETSSTISWHGTCERGSQERVSTHRPARCSIPAAVVSAGLGSHLMPTMGLCQEPATYHEYAGADGKWAFPRVVQREEGAKRMLEGPVSRLAVARALYLYCLGVTRPGWLLYSVRLVEFSLYPHSEDSRMEGYLFHHLSVQVDKAMSSLCSASSPCWGNK
eukprot:1139225-Pelagomonas_calceolata.AAC.7